MGGVHADDVANVVIDSRRDSEASVYGSMDGQAQRYWLRRIEIGLQSSGLPSWSVFNVARGGSIDAPVDACVDGTAASKP
jgi:hypothetical protein